MRSLEGHLAYLGGLFLEMQPPAPVKAQERASTSPGGAKLLDKAPEWDRARQWISAAGGLQWVGLDMFSGSSDNYLCSTAADYEEAQNHEKSRFVTEQTRLHFAWNAAERLIKILYPKTNKGSWVLAKESLNEGWVTRPELAHYSCTLEHLQRHVLNDAAYRENAELADIVKSESPASLLLAGAKMRHMPAHGDLVLPEAEDWDVRYDFDSTPDSLHAPRLGCRSLAIAIQMILILSSEASDRAIGLAPPVEGGWAVVQADGRWHWRERPPIVDLISQAHLEPPDEEDIVWDSITRQL